eukprot:Em0002g520a
MANISNACDQLLQFTPVAWRTCVSVALGAASLLISCVDVAAFFAMKLHLKMTYRLAIYQVVSSMALSAIISAGVLLVQYSTLRRVVAYTCLVFMVATKYAFTMWLTVHVFAAVVYYKNISPRLEPLYATSAILIPLAMTLAYMAAFLVEECSHDVVRIGLRVLIYATVALLLLNVALILQTVIVLLYRMHRPLHRRPLLTRHYRLALREVVPLLGYPVVTLFTIAAIAITTSANNNTYLKDTVYEFALPILNAMCGVLFMVHIAVVVTAAK